MNYVLFRYLCTCIPGPHSRRYFFVLTFALLWATIIAQIHQAQPAVGDSGRPVVNQKKKYIIIFLNSFLAMLSDFNFNLEVVSRQRYSPLLCYAKKKKKLVKMTLIYLIWEDQIVNVRWIRNYYSRI